MNLWVLVSVIGHRAAAIARVSKEIEFSKVALRFAGAPCTGWPISNVPFEKRRSDLFVRNSENIETCKLVVNFAYVSELFR